MLIVIKDIMRNCRAEGDWGKRKGCEWYGTTAGESPSHFARGLRFRSKNILVTDDLFVAHSQKNRAV